MSTVCKAPKEAQSRIDQTLEYFTIAPVNLDPSGIIGKLEHVVRLQDDRVRNEIKAIAPQADAVQLSVAQNILEVATSLNVIFKIVRHFFIQGQKTKSIYILIQLQMIMPIIMQEADALVSAIDAFKLAQQISEGTDGAALGQVTDHGDAQPVDTSDLFQDGVKVQ